MSTTDQSQDRRLPATWEEYQRERRDAFIQGARLRSVWLLGGADLERIKTGARRLYPIIKRVPRVLNDGHCDWRMVDGELEYRLKPGVWGWQQLGYNAERLKLFVDLMESPFEEVSE